MTGINSPTLTRKVFRLLVDHGFADRATLVRGVFTPTRRLHDSIVKHVKRYYSDEVYEGYVDAFLGNEGAEVVDLSTYVADGVAADIVEEVPRIGDREAGEVREVMRAIVEKRYNSLEGVDEVVDGELGGVET